MLGYIAGRILQGLINILFITVLVFILARASGDPVESFVPRTKPARPRSS